MVQFPVSHPTVRGYACDCLVIGIVTKVVSEHPPKSVITESSTSTDVEIQSLQVSVVLRGNRPFLISTAVINGIRDSEVVPCFECADCLCVSLKGNVV